MDYTFLERLTGEHRIIRGELTPRCDLCKARTRTRGGPKLFLLPVCHGKSYPPSAEYYAKSCRPLDRVEDIPVGQRACRMWPLVCPKCEARAVAVVDFLRVRGQEVTEKIAVCDYPPLASLLSGTRLEGVPKAPKAQSFGYTEVIGQGRR